MMFTVAGPLLSTAGLSCGGICDGAALSALRDVVRTELESGALPTCLPFTCVHLKYWSLDFPVLMPDPSLSSIFPWVNVFHF